MGKDAAARRAQRKIGDALKILAALGMPQGQQNERSALTLLALLDLKPGGAWRNARRPLMGITPVMEYARKHYARDYAPNTRETFRRQTMHQFMAAGIALYNPDDPERPVNSPKACYQISKEALAVVSAYGTSKWGAVLAKYLSEHETLAAKWARRRQMSMTPVKIAKGKKVKLTPGAHSKLIKQIITEFAPRFAPGAELLYVGDTGNKTGYLQKRRLAALGITLDKHGKLPDVVLHFEKRDWLFLVEAAASHGPIDANAATNWPRYSRVPSRSLFMSPHFRTALP